MLFESSSSPLKDEESDSESDPLSETTDLFSYF